jgi:hypothetical protein
MTEPRKVVIGNAELWLGDCRDVLPMLPKVDAVITDPVWPKHGGMFGDLDAHALLAETLTMIDASRVVIHMRNDQDPRFLTAVPERWLFLQMMWLRFAAVGHMGRFLTGNDVAYAFGIWPKSRPGEHSMPAIGPVESRPVRNGHPCPRSLTHVTWLVGWWSETDVLDPFMGSGTTGVACMNSDRSFIGIEREPKYFDIACRRIEDAQRQGRLIA